jgi:probable F420-dependent oxidoreductase
MRFALGLPTTEVDAPEEFLTGTAIAEMARHAEALGFDAVHVTDHPAGDQQWLDTGGHHALDPFVALSFAAAATTTLRMQTHIVVLPYRNPFLTAKSVLSLDVLSGGRLTLGVAAGYLRSEFNALGVDYDERNDLFDEALEVMRLALTEDAVAYEGRHFRSRGTTMRPRPVQQPCPPVWIGGNSLRAMEKAVESADGWCPFPNPASTSPALKTPKLETLDEFGARVERARAYAAEIGRTAPFDICFAPLSTSVLAGRRDLGALRDELSAYEDLGVTQVPVGVHTATTRAEWMAKVEQLASDLMP